MLGWTRNRFKTPRSGSSAFINHHLLAPTRLDLEIWRFCGFSQDSGQNRQNPNRPLQPSGPNLGVRPELRRFFSK